MNLKISGWLLFYVPDLLHTNSLIQLPEQKSCSVADKILLFPDRTGNLFLKDLKR